MIQEKAKVLLHRKIARDHYRMRLKSPAAARQAMPGQFIHLRCGEEGLTYPLLRRPLSLSDVDPRTGTMDFIYKVVGLGTNLLAQIRTGDSIDFLGPLGRPFEMPLRSQVACLVGGGVGIPPLYFLAKKLRESDPLKGARINPGTLPLCQTPGGIEVFLGARTKRWVICADDFRKLGLPVHIATDDGTQGHRGSVVDLVASVIASGAKQSRFKSEIASGASYPRNDISLYICGPTGMMKVAAALARRRGIPAQVSLEERMGCAMGCCMGCVVEVNTEPVGSHARFQRICTEGPVFPAEAVIWR